MAVAYVTRTHSLTVYMLPTRIHNQFAPTQSGTLNGTTMKHHLTSNCTWFFTKRPLFDDSHT